MLTIPFVIVRPEGNRSAGTDMKDAEVAAGGGVALHRQKVGACPMIVICLSIASSPLVGLIGLTTLEANVIVAPGTNWP